MTFDDEITAALRRDLQAVQVSFDAAGADDMIRVATQSDPVGERRAYAAPLAAAAAVVVIGGGVATFAATRDTGTPTGGGPVAPVPCATSSAVASLVPPPVYSGPASADPTTATTVPPVPTTVPSTSYYNPLTPPANVRPSSSTAALPPPEEKLTPSAVPNSGATDEPCPTSTSAPDAPSAVPSASASDLPAVAPNCTPDMIDPGFSGCITFNVRATVAPGSGSASFPIPNVPGIPSTSHFTVLTYDVENPGTNSGTVTIEQDNTIIARHRFLAGTNSSVRSVDSPIEISTDHKAEVRLSCESTTTQCAVRVSVAARIVQTGSPIDTATDAPTPTPTKS